MVIAFAAGLIGVYLARDVLLFVSGAIILSCMLSPIARWMAGKGVPRIVASLLLMSAFLVFLGFVFTRLVSPMIEWMESPPPEFERLSNFLSYLREEFEKVDQASKQLGEGDSSGNGEVVVDLADPSVAELVLSRAPSVVGLFAATVILLYFLLCYGDLLLLKLVEVSPQLEDKKRVVEIVREMEWAVSRYLLTVTVINFLLGVSVGGALALMGFQNAWIWGVVAMVLNYVPYVGAIIGVTLLTVVSFMQYESPSEALIFPAAYAALTVLEGNFITPTILGRSFSMNPIFIILSLLFFGWLWGAVGALLAVPLLVIFKSITAQTSHYKWAEVVGR